MLSSLNQSSLNLLRSNKPFFYNTSFYEMINTEDGHPVNFSRTTMTELIMPNDTNPLGNLMGGNLMRWMDIAAGICAARHCGAHCVTASVDNVSFAKPIHLGDVITIKTSVTRAFTTSVEVYLEVFTTSSFGADLEKSNHAYITMVAVDSRTSRPKKVPAVIPETPEEKKILDEMEKNDAKNASNVNDEEIEEK